MKYTLMALLLLGASTTAFSQSQLPNVGFENWTNVGQNTEEPLNFNSNKTGGGLAGFGPQTCYQATSPFSGTYCTELRTKNYLGTAVNGTATTGKVQAPNSNPSDGYIETVRADGDFSWPFTGKPDSLVGYYKYVVSGNDQGKVQVYLHGDHDVRNPMDASSIPFVYAEAKFLTPHADVSTWTRFSVPFTYNSTTTPSYALVVCVSSSEALTAVDGSKMWLDDVHVVYNPVIGVAQPQSMAISSHWSGDDLVIDLGDAVFGDAAALEVVDLQGRRVLQSTLTNSRLQRIPTDLLPGVYVLRIKGESQTATSKVLKVN